MPSDATPLDRFACYELCVQSTGILASFLHALHAQQPTVLREDFAGTAALSRRWVRDGLRVGQLRRALAVELDEPTLARARALAIQEGIKDGIEFVRADCLTQPALPTDGADIVFVGNFSIGYIHHRTDLLAYFRACRQRLALGNAGFGGGLLAVDTYGGASAFQPGGLQRVHPSKGKAIVHYAWRHEQADPRTAMVENSISFRVEVDGQIIAELPRAFVYRWRLWSIAELREAMHEAGFASTEVYKEVRLAPGQTPSPVASPEELGTDWVVLIAARTD